MLHQESRKLQKAARESRVVMYRKYREGDLPDIQIKYSEIIRPLQALANVSLLNKTNLLLVMCFSVGAERQQTLQDVVWHCLLSSIF